VLLCHLISPRVRIAGGIADINAFTEDPEFYAYGMMWALIVGGVWQIAASHFELNVSATHSIVGAIIGFSLVKGGGDAVIWSQKVPHVAGQRRPFPPVKGACSLDARVRPKCALGWRAARCAVMRLTRHDATWQALCPSCCPGSSRPC
jgi:hypothetical protein